MSSGVPLNVDSSKSAAYSTYSTHQHNVHPLKNVSVRQKHLEWNSVNVLKRSVFSVFITFQSSSYIHICSMLVTRLLHVWFTLTPPRRHSVAPNSLPALITVALHQLHTHLLLRIVPHLFHAYSMLTPHSTPAQSTLAPHNPSTLTLYSLLAPLLRHTHFPRSLHTPVTLAPYFSILLAPYDPFLLAPCSLLTPLLLLACSTFPFHILNNHPSPFTVAPCTLGTPSFQFNSIQFYSISIYIPPTTNTE